MNQPVISVEGLSKAFRIYKKPTDMLVELLSGKQRHDLFWALKDLSFEVCEHDRIGIIGANGSGKSTLLKIITGNLQKTSGQVEVRGKISAMLSLATSLNPEETGLSNIKFNLMLNGCTKSLVDQVTEEIIEFTELGAFIYQPVKTYSAGMNAKLAFGIATAIEPEILIVDEVLSVGDGYFVSKAMKRMVDLCNRGKALLFVSHSTSAVQTLCNKVVWLENGSIRMMGPTEHVLRLYEDDYRRKEDETTRAGNRARAVELDGGVRVEDLSSEKLIRMRLVARGGGAFHDTHYIRSLKCVDVVSQKLLVDLKLTETADRENSEIGLDLFNSEWGRVYERHGFNCRTLGPRTGKSKGGGFTVPVPEDCPYELAIQIEVESQGLLGDEHLAVEWLDYETGSWAVSEIHDEDSLTENWVRFRANVHFKKVEPTQLLATQKLLAKQALKQVEIVDVDLRANAESMRAIRENAPFEVVVHVRANRPTPVADVGLKLMRSDGVYVFWQSSGMLGANLENIVGEASVTFDFSNNELGAGDYELSVSVANGWAYPDNYPYSEIFDRRVGCLQFKVMPEFPSLDFGILNIRVPVKNKVA